MGLKEEKQNNKKPVNEDVYEAKREKKLHMNKHGIPQKRRAFPRKKPYVVGLLLMGIATAVLLMMFLVMNVIPTDLTLILVAVIMGLLVLTSCMFASRHRWKRIIGILIASVFIVVVASVASFMGNTYAMLNRISSSTVQAVGPKAKAIDVTSEPFNIYITGIDQWESEKGLDLERSDVNMLVSVNPTTKKVMLTSIPRDTYVKLHTAQQMDKLTHTGIYGVDETINTVEDWFDIDINYYVKMNFSAAKQIIDAMGGITVYSPVAFESSISDYKYKKGKNKMGGKAAVYFARERKSFEGQDAIRVENQQRVVKAILKKMTSSTTLLTSYGDVMKAAGDNIATNMSASDMKALVKMQITELSTWEFESQKIEGDYDMDYVASLSQRNKYSIYRPKDKSVEKCKEGVDSIFNPPEYELKKAEEDRNKSFVVNMIRKMRERIKGDDEEDNK